MFVLMDDNALPALNTANAAFVTPHLLVGGDLDTQDGELAARQLRELVDVGVTHVLDTRIEWNDEQWVGERAPELAYLHHGMDDAGQRVPGAWFEVTVTWALEAMRQGGTVLTHCHMGINRGPSLGFAVLLAQDWDAVDALDAIRSARPIAWIAYAEDALRWHHGGSGTSREELDRDRRRLVQWREDHGLDLDAVLRAQRSQGY